MRRRRYQRGSLKPRKRGGKRYWYAQWRENGNPRSKELGLCSKVSRSEAETRLAGILRPINAGVERKIVRDQTFGEYVENVFLPVQRRKWKRSTAMTTEQQIRTHLIPTLANQLMRAVNREELQDLLDAKAAVLSRSVVHHLRFQLRAIFVMAVSEGVAERNPAVALHSPRLCKEGRQRTDMTVDDVRQLFSIFDQRECLISRLATCEGMRPGEILGLQIEDFRSNSKGDFLRVRRRIYKGDTDSPKNGREREIGVSPTTARLLRRWISTLQRHTAEAWLFPSENLDTPISLDNLWRRNMLPKLKAAGLGWVTFQVMRRTHGNVSKKHHIDPKVSADQRGHGLGTAMDVYIQSDLDEKLDAARRLGAILDPKPEETGGAEPLMQ